MISGFSKYDCEESTQSKYHYPNTSIYINKLNIRDKKKLERYERDMTQLRQYVLEKENAVKGNFSKTHLKNIHHFIFQDVYYFAGEFRTETIHTDRHGIFTQFCRHEFIENQLDQLLKSVHSSNYFRDQSKNAYCSNLADFIADLNIIHPFREGNGRASREFVRQLVKKSGQTLRWSDKDRLLYAMLCSSQCNNNPLIEYLLEYVR